MPLLLLRRLRTECVEAWKCPQVTAVSSSLKMAAHRSRVVTFFMFSAKISVTAFAPYDRRVFIGEASLRASARSTSSTPTRRASAARVTVSVFVCVCVSTLIQATRRPISDISALREPEKHLEFFHVWQRRPNIYRSRGKDVFFCSTVAYYPNTHRESSSGTVIWQRIWQRREVIWQRRPINRDKTDTVTLAAHARRKGANSASRRSAQNKVGSLRQSFEQRATVEQNNFVSVL